MAEPFLVYEFARHTVSCVISQATELPIAQIDDKAHLNYIISQLEMSEARSLVVEPHYVDRDYLADYTHFHARSFQSYERFCTRLHFFRRSFTPSMFESLVTGLGFEEANIEDLRNDYLGFMVIRPLARFIGRTCLRLPPGLGWHAPMRHRYSVGLFGIELEVRDTVAFQEQDNVLAACATCAVWFTLHAKSDNKLIPSPGSITRQAMREDSARRRAFPNSGLNVDEIRRALKREHYEVVLHDFKPSEIGPVPEWSPDIDMREAKRFIYGYLRGGVAAPILGVALFEKGSSTSFAHHAITVMGYRLKNGPPPAGTSDGATAPSTPRLLADGIEALLVHDDKAGPFCEIKIVRETAPLELVLDGKTVTVDLTLAHPLAETGKGRVGGKKPADIFQIISVVALATYHKIRLQLTDVIHYVHQFEGYIRLLDDESGKLRSYVFGGDEQGFIWDIYIADSTAMKKDVREAIKAHGDYPADAKKRLIADVAVGGWPRYVWRATAYRAGEEVPAFDLIVDSTDTIQIGSLIKVVFYSPDTEQRFRELLVDEAPIPDASMLIDGLISHFVPPPRIQVIDADDKYGRPHPPRLIKQHEVEKNQQRLAYTQERCFVLSDGLGRVSAETGADEYRTRLSAFLHEKKGASSPCIWLIDKYCNIVLAEEAPSQEYPGAVLGHPTLIGGEPARISGELKWDCGIDRWILTNESGRYSRLQPDRGPDQLKYAADLFNDRLAAISLPIKVANVWKDEYGPKLIHDANTAAKVIAGLGLERDVREQLSLVRDWARELVNNTTGIIPGVVAGLVEIGSAAQLDRTTLLTMGFLHQLWDLRPDMLDAAHVAAIGPRIAGDVAAIGIQDGDGDDERCKREVLAALCVALDAKGGDMLDALKVATDWQLPEQLRAGAKRARDRERG